LLTLYPDRFIALGWLGVSFMAPSKTKFDLEGILALMKKTFGSEVFAYWQFFDREDAPAIIEKNVSSRFTLLLFIAYLTVLYKHQGRQFHSTSVSKGSWMLEHLFVYYWEDCRVDGKQHDAWLCRLPEERSMSSKLNVISIAND
jgi:hypothetical protein